MPRQLLALCAMLVLTSFAAFAQVAPGGAAGFPFLGFEDTYQVTYFSATDTNNGTLNLVNSGAYTPPSLNINTGYMCANVYVFASNSNLDRDREQMAACCTCPISRNGSRNIRARELLQNTLLPGPFTSATVKVVWTRPANDAPSACNAEVLPTGNPLAAPAGPDLAPVPGGGGFATGGRCWATRWHAAIPGNPAFGAETQCANAPLAANEAYMLGTLCNIIWRSLGSGAGRCPVCPGDGLEGAAKK